MDSIRMWRSIKVKFPEFSSTKLTDDRKDETFRVNEGYTDEELKKIADAGFNSIWTYGIMRNIVKTRVFPELGEYSNEHLKNIRKLIKRAAKYGLKVFIMTQEPRSIPAKSSFWKNHSDVKGTLEDGHTGVDGKKMKLYTLCTSNDKVKKYLKELFANMAKKLPALGGVMLITASEFPSHCWGNRGYKYDETGARSDTYIVPECPRCKNRNPVDIVNEVIQAIHEGIRSVSNDMTIIASNWSWNMYEEDPSSTIIKNLSKDVLVMPEFDRGGKKVILGKEREMDEYSISYIGPADRFKDSFRLARKHGIKTIAKLQFGTTHELATVPNLPLIGNLYGKTKFLRQNNIRDFEGCWNFGNMLTANTSAFNFFMTKKDISSRNTELNAFAGNYFPGCDAASVTKAWLKFGEAMDSYPYTTPFLYAGPINYALAYPIKPGKPDSVPCGRSWLPDKIRGDNLDKAFGCFTLNEIIKGFRIVHNEWKEGVHLLENGLKNSDSIHKTEELNTARCCYHVFRSAWNIYRAYKIRKSWTNKKMPEFLEIIKNEIENVKMVLPLLESDKRLGFHGEAFAYMFDAGSIRKKIKFMKKTAVKGPS